MRRTFVLPLLVLVGWLASACEETDSQDSASFDAFAAVTVAPSIVPMDQVASCVDSTKFGAFTGDVDASARWNAAGQSDAALIDSCTQIGRDDPTALATMHWNWTAAQAAITTPPPAPVVQVVNNCDPSYPDMCIPVGAPDLDCADIPNRRFTVLQPDPHRFDEGGIAGIGCESD